MTSSPSNPASDPVAAPAAAAPLAHSKRLGRADWIAAAIRVMADSSVEQVRVEKLAIDLKASKGSFYWHFKDRNALLAAVLEEWQARSTLMVQERLMRDEPDVALRIKRLMELPFHSGAAALAADLELAIMGWARRSAAARAAVGAVDAARTAYLVDQFVELGCGVADAQWRAHQAYALLRYVAQRTDLALADRQQMIAKLHARLTQDCAAGH
ncbi:MULTISPECIES: TetR/AcrR family transcriptional regulator [Novosphingobium]|uniref:TetR/AcrR family transcriptional regulator n=1 Tax=Novosphingobium TaxID=165696 RepID=UPI0009FF9071|nr:MULTISPECIES: TetR/AcrR family transcriptional regulator [Novosphingobium]WQD93891.1 TetR/AcrR family transcriptional regulator [Novosphingobium capsulatum]